MVTVGGVGGNGHVTSINEKKIIQQLWNRWIEKRKHTLHKLHHNFSYYNNMGHSSAFMVHWNDTSCERCSK